MPNHIAVVFIHGINVNGQNYHAEMRHRIKQRLGSDVLEHVTFDHIWWADIVRGRQQSYIEKATARSAFRDSSFRRFMVEGLGDAAAYQKTRKRENSAYFKIQERIRDKINDLDVADHPRRPLLIVAHSLGCHIASSFAWDVATVKNMTEEELSASDEDTRRYARYLNGGSPFRRLDTLAGIVTMGSNMPLFTFTFGPDRVFPITRPRVPGQHPAFPGRDLSPAAAERARWLNFYSRNDLLGYPLKPLNDAYKDEPRLTDIEVNSEGFLGQFVPPPWNTVRAHTGYWTNRRVIGATAKLIEEQVTAGDASG